MQETKGQSLSVDVGATEMHEYIIVVGSKVVWTGRDAEAAFAARDAMNAARDGGYNLPGQITVYKLADESDRGRF
jgi:hypothetical protein